MKSGIIASIFIMTMTACSPGTGDAANNESETFPSEESLIIEDGMEEADSPLGATNESNDQEDGKNI